MLKHFTAALAALFFLFPLSAVGESLDLSQLGAIEEAEHWEERAWYQREDGSDWRVQDDGSVIVTLSATGDVTIGGDTRKRGQSIFDTTHRLSIRAPIGVTVRSITSSRLFPPSFIGESNSRLRTVNLSNRTYRSSSIRDSDVMCEICVCCVISK